ncbi:MAG: SH3 domain-containing protein [Pseudomonadota bacterium]
MRLATAAPLVALLGMLISSAGPVQAAAGDLWSVDRQNVNVRSGPSTSTDVLMTINPGERIVEIASKGEWFFVEFPDRGERGWVYAPLLTSPGTVAAAASVATAPSPERQTPESGNTASTTSDEAPQPDVVNQVEAAAQPQASTRTAAISPDEEPAAVKSFRDTVAELNDRAVSVAGIDLFSDVRSTGGGGVQVLATETWASVPEAGQSSYMNALFDRWQSVASGLEPLSLQIIDPNGQIMMERTGS